MSGAVDLPHVINYRGKSEKLIIFHQIHVVMAWPAVVTAGPVYNAVGTCQAREIVAVQKRHYW